MSDIAWGSAPDWLVFVATALYLVVTYLLLRHATGAERRQISIRDAAARRGQADLLAAWCSEIRTSEIKSGPNAGTLVHSVHGLVRNASTLPVYEVQVMIGSSWPEDDKWPHAGWLIGGGPYGSRVLGPGDTVPWTLSTQVKDPSITPPVQLTFTDASRIHWMRDPFGGLVETKENQFDRRQWNRQEKSDD